MTVKVTLPTPRQPYLETGPLPADFYAYEELLSDTEREKIGRIRDFFRTEAAPIVDDYWARAEFPIELVKGFAKLGLLDWADPDSTEPAPSTLLTGHHRDGDGARRPVDGGVLRRAQRPGDGQHRHLRVRGAEAPLAAGDGRFEKSARSR